MIDYERRGYRPCVGAVILNSQGHIWVGKRLDNSADAWQMPQGGVEDGEDLLEAVLREVWEETSMKTLRKISEMSDPVYYDVPKELADTLWNGFYRGQTQKWFLFRFEGDEKEIDLKTKHPEFADWKWLEPVQVMDAIVPFKQDVYRQVFSYFQL